jgi:predicted AAA+ superfamily ATPase
MLSRSLTPVLRSRLARNPAVAVVGPRQVGKTTLARSLGGAYFDLEQPADRLRLDLSWEDLLRASPLIVLDEAQSWPEVFPRLRGAIDADRRRNGRFLLLGSVSPGLMRAVSESLAGRLALVELMPFLLGELEDTTLSDLWLLGGFPDGGVLGHGGFPEWQTDYLTLLAERDLPVWGLPAASRTTLRLLRMLAAVHGQIWNASQIGQSLGLSYHTVNTYVDFLEGAFLVRRLPPWLPNLKKRLVRSPRVYWRDSGLLHALLGVRSVDDLLAQPWVGASWEGFVIHQVLGSLAAAGVSVEPHYFRTSDGYEADLVFRLGTVVWAIEAKLTASPSPGDFGRLLRAAEMIGADQRYLVAQVPSSTLGKKSGVASLPDLIALLRASARAR